MPWMMCRASAPFVVLVGFVLVTTGVRAQDGTTKKQAEAALKEYAKYAKNKNEHVRKAAVDGLAPVDHPLAIDPLIDALGDPSPLVVDAAVVALSKQTTKPALAELTRRLNRARDPNVKVAILEAFKVTRPKVAFDTVMRLTSSKDFAVKLAAVELLGLLPDEKDRAGPRLLELSADRDPQIRLTALDSLVAAQRPSATARCIEILEGDPDWRVRAAAISALRSFRKKESIVPLINAMEREDGRLADDAHAALIDITGMTYSAKTEVWRRWWTRVADRFEVPTLAEIREKKKKLAAAMAEYTGGDHEYTPYHGIKTRSKRMLFVLDVSASMADKVVLASKDPNKIAEFKKRYGDYEYKIDLAREELINTIAQLKPYVRFNIVTFSSKVKKWKPKLVKATAGNRNAAIKFLARLTPERIAKAATVDFSSGKTNTFDALNVAFGLGKDPGQKPSKNHTVESDTVFFLTDGMPTAGRITDPGELLRYFRVVNRRAKIVFHTICFGHGNEALMQPMAELSGGRYVVIQLD